MKTRLEHVKLSEITVSETNAMFRDESELTQDALQELIDSIKEQGVIQPVLLRPLPTGGYQLICGERRFRASSFLNVALKNFDSIPANIREMTDAEAFDCQVTENLQRKDVHPLKESKAYKSLMDQDAKITASELALRFGKTEHYILTRLKLNDLVPEGKKDYQAGKMTLGHALLIARLSPEDQKEAINECGGRYYETIDELEDFIERSVLCNLNSVPFKKDDLTLNPKAGACTTCPKRSGANQLFADIKDKDRCFDSKCFDIKKFAFLSTQVRELLETHPETIFLQGRHDKINPEIDKVLKEFGVKPLMEHDDFSYYSYDLDNAKKTKGFCLNGRDAGAVKSVYVKKGKEGKAAKVSVDGKQSPAEIKALIEGIQQRTKRAAELDKEKVYVRIIEALKKSEPFTKVSKAKWTKTDDVLVLFMILEHSGYGLIDKLRKMFKLPQSHGASSDKFIEALYNLTIQDSAAIARITMLEHFAGQAMAIHGAPGKLLRIAAEEYGGVNVKAFDAEQEEIRKKREARANERIEALKASLKPKPAKPAKATKSKPEPAQA